MPTKGTDDHAATQAAPPAEPRAPRPLSQVGRELTQARGHHLQRRSSPDRCQTNGEVGINHSPGVLTPPQKGMDYGGGRNIPCTSPMLGLHVPSPGSWGLGASRTSRWGRPDGGGRGCWGPFPSTPLDHTCPPFHQRILFPGEGGNCSPKAPKRGGRAGREASAQSPESLDWDKGAPWSKVLLL